MEVWDYWVGLTALPADLRPSDAWQALGALLAFVLIDRLLGVRIRKGEAPTRYSPLEWIRYNRVAIVYWALLVVVAFGAHSAGQPLPLIRFFAVLFSTWVAIGLAASLLRQKFWAESVAFVLYIATGIQSLSLQKEIIPRLEGFKFTIGSFSVTAYGIIAGIIAFVLALWISLAVARIAESRIDKISALKPSLRVLLIKVLRFLLVFLAVVVAVSSMGVDLSALTVFGGAIGLGLGFGFQKVISNLVSGIILLTDNSIKPGDVIEIEGTYGWINNLRARYASVITRDGTEHLIPNEDLITQRVVNWSFTNNLVRIKTPVGVSYKEDPHRVIRLVQEAASSVPRVLEDPAPVCLLTGFGDSSVDLELRFWLADPSNGVANVRSQVLLKVWDTFQENGIEIPFPQRDVHIKPAGSQIPQA